MRDVDTNKRALGAWIAGGWLFFFGVAAATWWLIPEQMTVTLDTLSARMVFALAHVFLASTVLFTGFLAVGATRWQLETADPRANPARSGELAANASVDNRVNTQVASNNTEQFVMFAAAVLAAAPFLTSPYLRIITAVTVLWIAGRMFFWAGYWYTAARELPTYPRAIGLGMGLLCTLILGGLAATGICLHYPRFDGVLSSGGGGGSTILLAPAGIVAGHNTLPIAVCTLIVGLMLVLALWPRRAPPVIPIAVVSCVTWIALLATATIPIR